MQGTATVHHHPIHPMLVAFPIGFWVGSIVADIIYGASGNLLWSAVAEVMIGFGCVGALLAAVFGFVDYLTARMSPTAKGQATWHLLLNVTALALFVISWVLRARVPGYHLPAGYVLSIVGIAAILVSGWLGGTLVYEDHVGVEDPAHDAGEQPGRGETRLAA